MEVGFWFVTAQTGTNAEINMKKLILTIGIILITQMSYSQQADSSWTASFGFKGTPTGIVSQKWSDTTLYFTVNYKEYIDTNNIYTEILKLQVNWDSVAYYKPQVYNNLLSKFFDSTEKTFLIRMAKEAAKERYFGYKKYFK